MLCTSTGIGLLVTACIHPIRVLNQVTNATKMPEALYLIEGAGQVGLGLSWGDNYAHARSLTDVEHFVSDPSEFSAAWCA